MTTASVSRDDLLSCATVAFRYRRRLAVTLVAKATFAIVPEGVATPITPRPIVVGDRTWGNHPTKSLEAASELAPYLPRCDVVLTGHAHARDAGTTSAAVRLALVRDGRPLLDKTLHVFGDRRGGSPAPFVKVPLTYERAKGGPGEANPVGSETPSVIDPRDPGRMGGFGPLAPFWPDRKRLLGTLDRRALAASPVDLPDDFVWAYYQCAPIDQQLEHLVLVGGEWLVLDGMHPERARLRTALPSLRPVARVLGVAGELGRLSCDMVVVDADALVLSLVWRGSVHLAADSELPRLRFLVGLDGPERPVDWARLEGLSQGRGDPPAVAPDGVGEGTLVADHVSREALPFAATPAGAARASRASLEHTPFDRARVVVTGPSSASESDDTLAVGEGTLALGDASSPGRGSELPFPKPEASREHAGQASTGGSHAEPRTMPGAPWGPLAPAVPQATAGEETLSLDAADAHREAGARAPEHTEAAERAPLEGLLPLTAPAPAAPVDPLAVYSPQEERPPTPPQPQPKAKPKTDPDSLAQRLRQAGASASAVSALLAALHPPPPPPPEDE